MPALGRARRVRYTARDACRVRRSSLRPTCIDIVPMTPAQERWAEALAIERWQGANAEVYVTARIAALARTGDEAGVRRFREIAKRLALLSAATPPD